MSLSIVSWENGIEKKRKERFRCLPLRDGEREYIGNEQNR